MPWKCQITDVNRDDEVFFSEKMTQEGALRRVEKFLKTHPHHELLADRDDWKLTVVYKDAAMRRQTHQILVCEVNHPQRLHSYY